MMSTYKVTEDKASFTDEPLSGAKLAEYLGSYSEKGDEYIELVKGMIKRDRLEIADSAKLAKGPIVVFRSVSK